MTRSSRPDSPGTGIRSWRLFYGALIAMTAAGPWACSPDFKDGVGPRVPVPNVSGRAERDGAAASALDVSVRDPVDNVSVASTRTDASGSYAIAAPSGVWEIRIKGKVAGDFDSVTRGFVVDGAGERVTMVPLDVFAYGAALVAPSDGEALARPSGSNDVTFTWSAPGRSFSSARAQLYDSTGTAVWFSAKGTASEATWDGTGNQGALSGVVMPAATYTWRVKFDLPDSSEARTKSYVVRLQ